MSDQALNLALQEQRERHRRQDLQRIASLEERNRQLADRGAWDDAVGSQARSHIAGNKAEIENLRKRT